jgi:hypothetical protein
MEQNKIVENETTNIRGSGDKEGDWEGGGERTEMRDDKETVEMVGMVKTVGESDLIGLESTAEEDTMGMAGLVRSAGTVESGTVRESIQDSASSIETGAVGTVGMIASGDGRAAGKSKTAKQTLRLMRAGAISRGFENAAEVFVYLETGSSGGDTITGVEIERGLKALKLSGQVDASCLVAALGGKARGKDVTVSFKDFMRLLSWPHTGAGPGSGSILGSDNNSSLPRTTTRPTNAADPGAVSGSNTSAQDLALLACARKHWKKTAERVRRHVQVSILCVA